MKTLKKNVIAGIGRAIGIGLVYGLISITLYASGIRIDLSKVPAELEGEIRTTLTN